ncbi:class I SAM-dependent methyltransferase [Mariniblastus sp.]|nr:class I SAM-dependent methyltransferase [Mariniblastus sp.]MDC3256162.1 class I SAM-dependent methyltransferase [bacterium]
MVLKRVLEPEVMDSEKEAQEYNDMDHSVVNQHFVEELFKFARDQTPAAADAEVDFGDVLDLGTGTALIPVELCRQDHDCRVMAVDLAVSMLELARYNVEAAGMIERITLAQVDAKRMGYDRGAFDLVMSNSIIHHIPDPVVCLQEMVRVTAENGLLFIRDLMRPQDAETLEALVLTYTGKESEYSQQLFRDSLHAALSLDEIRDLVASLGFDSNSVQATSDRHWTWAAVNLEDEADAG